MDVDLVDAADVIDADTLDADNADNTDTLDADTWEALQAIGPNQGHASVVPLSPPPRSELRPPTPPLNPPIPDDSGIDSPAQLTVDSFPSGSPGAKILDPLQEHAACQSQERDRLSSIWAPFRSSCDWNVALWAKTRGPTSTALTELLQIPEVRTSHTRIIVLLICQGRFSTG